MHHSRDLNASTAFRIGTDGTTAPLASAPPSTTLPQPFFPGIGANIEGSTASPLDPHFRPNSVDSIDLSIQHQITSKVSVEVGAISRWIHNELQNINLNSVPYMMTKGGQQFQTAYAAVEKAMGCTTSATACSSATCGFNSGSACSTTLLRGRSGRHGLLRSWDVHSNCCHERIQKLPKPECLEPVV